MEIPIKCNIPKIIIPFLRKIKVKIVIRNPHKKIFIPLLKFLKKRIFLGYLSFNLEKLIVNEIPTSNKKIEAVVLWNNTHFREFIFIE
jgi:hypothetical protein